MQLLTLNPILFVGVNLGTLRSTTRRELSLKDHLLLTWQGKRDAEEGQEDKETSALDHNGQWPTS